MTQSRLQLPIPINEAESIIDPFWDQHISALPRYTLNAPPARQLPPACNPRALQFWCWATLKWDQAIVGQPIVTYERDMQVSLDGYDRLMIRLGIPEHVSLRVDAVVDGQAQCLLDRAPGTGAPYEYEAALIGRRLEHLRLTLTSGRDQADEGWLYWIGLAATARRAEMLGRPQPFDERWEGWLLPPEAQPEFAPRFGFFFSAEELPAIRRRALSPAYAGLMEQMRTRARLAMDFHRSPEELVGPYLPAGEVWKVQARTRDWDTYPFFSEAPLIALVGLIDQDAEILRFAARIAVATAHCRSWAPHFMQDFPGSTWDTRAFTEAHAASGVALTLDWAGAWFTDPGEHLLRYAITHKAMGRVRGIFLQYDYMWDCNQHHLIGIGRLLGLLVQERGWSRARADIDQFERDLIEMIDRYIQPDGSSFEGIGYWGASFQGTLPALAALARYRGLSLDTYLATTLASVKPKLERMWNFVAPLLATAGEPSAFLPISDTSFNLLPWDTIGMAAAALHVPGWRGLLGACLNGGKTSMVPSYWTIDGAFTAIFGPDEPAAPSIDVPVFRKLETAGMLTSNRPWAGSNVRLHLVGAMAGAGHCHPDKGSFILEACGDTFGGDRGVTPYVDPRCRTLASEVAHNLAVPEGCFQINPGPVATLWEGAGDADTLVAQIDTSAIWQPPVTMARRAIRSPQPNHIEIVDEFVLSEPRPVTFYLNTPLPVTVQSACTQGACAHVHGAQALLTVEAAWATGATAGEYYCDFAYRPYHRLAITSAPATRHRLTTLLRFTRPAVG